MWDCLEVKWNSDTWYKPQQTLKLVQQLQEGICQRQNWDVFIWHDWFCWVSRVSPTRWCPLSPLKAAGALTLAALALKAELFSAQGLEEPPPFRPTSNIPFSCRDNFIHLVHHCIQLNAETMLTLECIELACVHVLTTGTEGEALCLNFFILTEMCGFILKDLHPGLPLRTCSVITLELNVELVAATFSVFKQLHKYLRMICEFYTVFFCLV